MTACSDEDVVEQVGELLTACGPLGEDALLEELRKRGVDLGEDAEEELWEIMDATDPPLAGLSDGRWAWMPALWHGRVLTHRLSDVEVAHDVLFLEPDLDPISLLMEDQPDFRLADGTAVIYRVWPVDTELPADREVPVGGFPDGPTWILPLGFLRALGVAAGELVGVSWSTRGLVIDAVGSGAVDDSAAATEQVARGFNAVLDELEPEMLVPAMHSLCAENADLFRSPVLPLAEIFDVCGIRRDDDWIARVGFDLVAWRRQKRVRTLAGTYQLTEDEAGVVAVACELFNQLSGIADSVLSAGEPDDLSVRNGVADSLSRLGEPRVAEAILDEVTGPLAPVGGTALGRFVEMLEPLAPSSARVALHWLRAKAYERDGNGGSAEESYLAAESLDPEWSPVLLDLARCANDRGDVQRGLSLLRRAGVPDSDPVSTVLERYNVPARPELGRNAQCWCGSGRKYKKCHLGNEMLPLAERCRWLYDKACLFAAHRDGQRARLGLAMVRGAHATSDEEARDAINDTLIDEALLFHDGALLDFIVTRGELLPEDERLMAEQWLLTERSVYEVTGVRAGRGLTLRDLRTGDVHDVRERTASRQLAVGKLVSTHVLPIGDTAALFGGSIRWRCTSATT